MEEEISRKIGAVMTEGGYPDLTDIESDINPVYQIYDIGAMKSQMIGSVKVALIPSRNVSETKSTVQDVPQAKTFQSKVRHSTVSPEELSERWQKGLKQAREAIFQNNTKNQLLSCNATSEEIQGRNSVPEQESHMHVGDRYHGRMGKVFRRKPICTGVLQWDILC